MDHHGKICGKDFRILQTATADVLGGMGKLKKSVYSVVLSDRVVSGIDRLAYAKGTNRSGMINRILAEYLSLTTPEMRISDIFEELSGILFSGEVFKMSAPPTPRILSARSVLSYKYNPTVRYAVELYRVTEGCEGEIRVSMRTKNEALTSALATFYSVWTELERRYGYDGMEAYEGEIFKREIKVRKSPLYVGKEANASAAHMIAQYISVFDGALKDCFSGEGDIFLKLDEIYRTYLSHNYKIL